MHFIIRQFFHLKIMSLLIMQPSLIAVEYDEDRFINELIENPIESIEDLSPYQWASMSRYLANSVRVNIDDADGDIDLKKLRAVERLPEDIKTPFFRYLYKEMICGLEKAEKSLKSFSSAERRYVSEWKRRLEGFYNRPGSINYKDAILDASVYYSIGERIGKSLGWNKLRKRSGDIVTDQKNFFKFFYDLFAISDESEGDGSLFTMKPVINPVVDFESAEAFLMANSVQVHLMGITLEWLSYDGNEGVYPSEALSQHDRSHRLLTTRTHNNLTPFENDLAVDPVPNFQLLYENLFLLKLNIIPERLNNAIFASNYRNAKITEKFIKDMKKESNELAILAAFYHAHELEYTSCGYYLQWDIVYNKYKDDPTCTSPKLVNRFEQWLKLIKKSDLLNQPAWKRLIQKIQFEVSMNMDDQYVRKQAESVRKQAESGMKSLEAWVMNNKELIFSK